MAAQTLVERDIGVTVGPDGRFRVADTLAHRAINRFVEGRSGILPQLEPAAEQAVVATTPTHSPFLCELRELYGGPTPGGAASRIVMITIYDPAFSMPLHIDGFAALHRLTASEASIVRLILDNCDTLRIADLRGTTSGTVRAQIKSILAKTNCRSRAELVRKAAAADLPPLSDSLESLAMPVK